MSNETRIVLIGKTGCGKSSTGNTILGNPAFAEAAGLKAGTEQCKSGESEYGGRKLVVVDTPGVYDSEHADQETVNEIVKCLVMANPGPHVFLWVLNAKDRFSNRDADIFKILKTMFGDNVVKYVVLVFTHVDEFRGDFTQEMQNPPTALNAILKAVERRWVAISNKEQDAQDSMPKLMNIISDVVQSRRTHFSNDLTRKIDDLVEKRLRELEEKHKVNHDEAREKLRKGLERGEENVLLTLACTAVGGVVGGAVGGFAGSFAGPGIGTTVGAGTGATAGAAVGVYVGKKCSIM